MPVPWHFSLPWLIIQGPSRVIFCSQWEHGLTATCSEHVGYLWVSKIGLVRIG